MILCCKQNLMIWWKLWQYQMYCSAILHGLGPTIILTRWAFIVNIWLKCHEQSFWSLFFFLVGWPVGSVNCFGNWCRWKYEREKTGEINRCYQIALNVSYKIGASIHFEAFNFRHIFQPSFIIRMLAYVNVCWHMFHCQLYGNNEKKITISIRNKLMQEYWTIKIIIKLKRWRKM